MLLYIIIIALIIAFIGNPFRARRSNYKNSYQKKKIKRRFK